MTAEWLFKAWKCVIKSFRVTYQQISSLVCICFIPDYFHSTPNCVHLSWSFEARSAPGITDGEIIHTRPPAYSHSVALLLMESYYRLLRA